MPSLSPSQGRLLPFQGESTLSTEPRREAVSAVPYAVLSLLLSGFLCWAAATARSGHPGLSHVAPWELGCGEPRPDAALAALLSVMNDLSVDPGIFIILSVSDLTSYYHFPKERVKRQERSIVVWDNSSFWKLATGKRGFFVSAVLAMVIRATTRTAATAQSRAPWNPACDLCAKDLPVVPSLSPLAISWGKYLYYLHFIEEEIKVQKG